MAGMYHASALASRLAAAQRLVMRLRCRGRLALVTLVTLAAAPALCAQGSIAGVVTDSVRDPAAGATVFLTRLSPQPGVFRSTVTDDRGHFHFDTLVAGRYAIAFATTWLDSLGITIPPREIALAPGETQRVDLPTPSGATLRAAACPTVTLVHGRGAVIGTVTNADTDRPLAAAHVAVSWTDLSVDERTLTPMSTSHSGDVAVDSLGRYRLCGVPTDTYLMLQVQDSGRAGSIITLTVGDRAGVAVRDLSLSVQSARSIASLDSAQAAPPGRTAPTSLPSAVAPLLTGTAAVAGTVRGQHGEPLANAEVRVRSAAGVARTDATGRFALGSQPAGSQQVEVRHVGYLLGQIPAELRSGRTTDITVVLSRIVSLDSIRVVARGSRYPEFESRRKQGFGRFLDEKEIDRRHPMEASDLFRDMMPGFQVTGEGLGTHLWTTHGKFELSSGGKNPCEVNVVVDGIQHQNINLLDALNIGAVEAYPGPPGAPPQYDSACGVVLIWTKR